MHTSESLLAVVQRSPDAVAAHDRVAWVNLYARAGVVNDPVGSRPHQGKHAIEKFYDTFIAPNTIHFHADNDMVSGMSVVRDLSLETIMSSGATLNVPMHIRYDLVEEDGELKVERLSAHWELATMVGQLMRGGVPGLTASAKLTPQLVSNQGISGVVGLMGGFRGVGHKGKAAASSLLTSAAKGETRSLFLPNGEPAPAELLLGASYSKLIAAGRTVSASFDSASVRGVVFIDFAAKGTHVDRITVFA